jgi:hypothetical protein
VTFSSRLSTAAWAIAGALAIASVVGWLLLRRPARLAEDAQAWTLCEQGYRRARVAADTQAVDNQQPVISRAQASVALTCGAMRVARRPR